MAKAVWVGVSPASGTGDGSVAVRSTAAHTGRNARNSNVTFKAANVEDIVVAVTQAGKPEFSTIATSAAPGKAGQTLTISGTSNSDKLTFSLGTGSLAFALPSTYKAKTVTTNNGALISGDPGSSAEFTFSITLVIPENETITSLSRQLIVTDGAGNTDICTITQAAGDAELTVTPGTIELDWQGTAETITVTSNTSWSVV